MKSYNLMQSIPLVVALLAGAIPSLAATIPAASITRFQRYNDCSLSPSSYEISRPSLSVTDEDAAYRACESECRRNQPDCAKFTAHLSGSATSSTTRTWGCILFTHRNDRGCSPSSPSYDAVSGIRRR